MAGLKDAKDYAVLKSLEAAHAVLEAGDDTDERRDLYAEAARYRTEDSFEREGDTLHVDMRGDSPLSEFASEMETSSSFEKLTGTDYQKTTAVEGFAEGLYRIFDESDAERVLLYSDDEKYFGPSISGIASMEVVRRMEEDRNIHWENRFTAEDYLWEEAFDERDQDLWHNWLDQRPDPE